MDIQSLKRTATECRMLVVDQVYTAKSGHPGGSLSITDALVVLYFNTMNIDPANPNNPDRDRFIMSKGHCSPAMYAVLAERGFFPKADLKLFRSINGHVSGHVEMKHMRGVDMSTGSLGQGLSIGIGMALGARLDNKDYRVYVAMGDGEVEEGQVWEASMAAAHYKLDNLCAMIDLNGLQIDGETKNVMNSAPLRDKYLAFGWNVIDVDGHDYQAIADAFETAKTVKGKPTMVLLHTTKGKGVSFMENNAGWHGKAPNAEQYEQAMAELRAELEA